MKYITRAAFSIRIPKLLWDSVESYCLKKNKQKSAISKLTPSLVFEETGRKLLKLRPHLPLKPNRRVTRPNTKAEYEKEFEFYRTSLYVNIELVEALLQLYNEIAQEQFSQEVGEVEMSTTLPCTVFFYFCKENNLKYGQRFFDDVYFEKKYTYPDEEILMAIYRLEQKLGKSITRTEWEKYRREINAPSLQTVIRRYGSFSRAKELARLSVEKKKEI
ncbi:hypothetical protein AM501_05275 [Aneurinibacillus migulanus]|uniref:homing endonuclease associated repeat-containing protein n=1 Tax=Aneurinibacillus migulanus TaxID=47500 RepID=UPI0005BD0683|nr:hypothetical protein [Aneurinibacillus migulanus]KIV58580.1 hypothetical protein TS64_04340 [Aneurinibacillus migulanus]KPD09248.1 hypothetical protein AM501_05275 [Aneurinibacillus migulanus]